jgi:DNA repair protein RadC
MERFTQRNLFEEPPVTRCEPPRDAMLREAVSQYLDLSLLRDPHCDIRNALRYDADSLPEEIKRMVGMLEILLMPAPQEQIKSPADLARYFQLKIGMNVQEQFWVVSVNTKNCVLSHDMLYQGSVNTTMIRLNEVFRYPMHYNAAAMFILHSHPSSFVEPSPEDILVTRQIYEASKLLECELLDSMIIGQGRWCSLREKGVGFGG